MSNEMGRLELLTIDNFRSIRGHVAVPLSAPVVLIHGLNGAGKTSVMSAIELALTGTLNSMRTRNPRDYLVHYGASSARIELTTSSNTGAVSLDADGIRGERLLDAASSRFFEERCYLTQSLLGRMLDIYQAAEGESASALTRFIRELLRLDHLDALIDGLHAVGDKRNVKRLVPEYARAEKELSDAIAKLNRDRESYIEGLAEAKSTEAVLVSGLRELSPVVGEAVPSDEEITELLDPVTDESRLTALVSSRRELAAITARWSSAGAELNAVVSSLRALFPDLPSAFETGPAHAYSSAMDRCAAEVDRLGAAINADVERSMQLANAEAARDRAASRVATINDQLDRDASEPETLAQALAGIVPHVVGDTCPVCDRDYRESSAVPLVAALAAKISSLTAEANRLQALSKAVLEASADLHRTEQVVASLSASVMRSQDRETTKVRLADCRDMLDRLNRIRGAVSEGDRVVRSAAEAADAAASAQRMGRESVEVRSGLRELASTLGLDAARPTEPVPNIVTKLRETLDDEFARLERRQSLRRTLRDLHHSLLRMRNRNDELRSAVAAGTSVVGRIETAVAGVEARREAAKQVARQAASSRTEIVRRVFNDSLNRVWRDLFVRLAPNEPYVPAFRLPETAGEKVTAVLETLRRDGGRGGAPEVMLSAGNLNTAALTLFLALHLSAPLDLQWLLLDDPVQSMDEVHIAQFAALLRTLSKQHGRQVIIALHDRPLFEYLTLELSPAMPGDRLITVDLVRAPGGDTLAPATVHMFEEDRAVSAA